MAKKTVVHTKKASLNNLVRDIMMYQMTGGLRCSKTTQFELPAHEVYWSAH